MKSYETFKSYRPRVGQTVRYRGEIVGKVTSIEGSWCYCSYPGGESLPFIWCFIDGLNALHDWPTKGDGKIACLPVERTELT